MRNYEPAAIAMRRARVLLQKAKDIQPPELVVCNPHGTNDESMHDRILTLETSLRALARTDNDYTFIIGTLDKASQNSINKVGGFTGAGDAAMAAYWEVARRAVACLAHVNNSEIVELIRMNLGSDEGVFNMGSRHLTRHAEAQFRVAWEHARRSINLRNYGYYLEVPSGGGTKTYELDLEAFTSVLRHPDMALSCHFSISQPRRIDPHAEGFVTDVIRSMENREIEFYDRLPWSFRSSNGGLAEVDSPFETNLSKTGIRKMTSGTLVEIKLNATEARELLRFVHDEDGRKGTRKGFAEIYSGNFGMRGFNTFLGKARANSILTPITWAMHDISTHAVSGSGRPVTVLPLNEGYLQYWVDLPPTEATRDLIKRLIYGRIHSTNLSPAYANLSFRPVIAMLDATRIDITDAKARFILDSLDKQADAHPPAVLERTDFLLNFIENIQRSVQQDIYDKLGERKNGGVAVSDSDMDSIRSIRQICSDMRNVRSIEDLVWIIRAADGLRPQIKHARQDLENWLFRFAQERAESIQRLLADRIRERRHARSA